MHARRKESRAAKKVALRQDKRARSSDDGRLTPRKMRSEAHRRRRRAHAQAKSNDHYAQRCASADFDDVRLITSAVRDERDAGAVHKTGDARRFDMTAA